MISTGVTDHFWQVTARSNYEMPQRYTALWYLAANSRRARLSVLITGTRYEHQSILVKTMITLGMLFGGRAWLGIGAGFCRGAQVGNHLTTLEECFDLLDRCHMTVRCIFACWHSFNAGTKKNDPNAVAIHLYQ